MKRLPDADERANLGVPRFAERCETQELNPAIAVIGAPSAVQAPQRTQTSERRFELLTAGIAPRHASSSAVVLASGHLDQ
jgi:hypothetical protein